VTYKANENVLTEFFKARIKEIKERRERRKAKKKLF